MDPTDELETRKIRSLLRQLKGKLKHFQTSLQKAPASIADAQASLFHLAPRARSKYTFKRKRNSPLMESQTQNYSGKLASQIASPARRNMSNIVDHMHQIVTEIWHPPETTRSFPSLLSLSAFAVGKLLAGAEDDQDDISIYDWLPAHCHRSADLI